MRSRRVLRFLRVCVVLALLIQCSSFSVSSATRMQPEPDTYLYTPCEYCTATLEYWDGSIIHTFHPTCTVKDIQNILLDVSGENAPQVISAGWVVVEGAGGWKGLDCIYSTLGQGDNFAGTCNFCEDSGTMSNEK